MSVDKLTSNFPKFDMDEASKVAFATGAALDDRSHAADDHFAYCNCAEKHPGRPSDISVGCGSRAYVKPPPTDYSDD